ncbi:MAG: branched-chain amino acid aminotransferase [Saprospiraceae bacterium]|nr:branched-chain amino acid aminotransferase [Saprospiraceae bacterium]
MEYPFEIQMTKNSRLEGLDLSSLPFGRTFSDHMFVADYKDGKWQDCKIVPYGPISFNPGLMALHYGQSIFEGMKANVSKTTGEPVLFRADKHFQRINKSAERLAMPQVPEEVFMKGLETLVSIDKGWIPNYEGSALYLRPFLFATDEFLGVRPSDTYRFMILACPVGPYYPKPVRILVAQKYVRAFPGGVGFAKAAGNYAASLKPAKIAKSEGYDQILWLDGQEFKYLQECGTMNIFAVIGDTVVTPPTGDTILDGVTRDSSIQLLKAMGKKVEERPISINELLQAQADGSLKEMFGTGTAAVVSHVETWAYQGTDYPLPAIEDRVVGPVLKKTLEDYKNNAIEDTMGWIKPVKELVNVK